MRADRDAEDYPSSPVPSDRRLCPRGLPFTALGQFGEDMLDLRVFDQEVWWADRRGRPCLLTEMSDEYIANVMAASGESTRCSDARCVFRDRRDDTAARWLHVRAEFAGLPA